MRCEVTDCTFCTVAMSGLVDLLRRIGIPETAAQAYTTTLAHDGFDSPLAFEEVTIEELETFGLKKGHIRLVERYRRGVSSATHASTTAADSVRRRANAPRDGADAEELHAQRGRRNPGCLPTRVNSGATNHSTRQTARGVAINDPGGEWRRMDTCDTESDEQPDDEASAAATTAQQGRDDDTATPADRIGGTRSGGVSRLVDELEVDQEQEAAFRQWLIKEEMQPCWPFILAVDVGWLLGDSRNMLVVGCVGITLLIWASIYL